MDERQLAQEIQRQKQLQQGGGIIGFFVGGGVCVAIAAAGLPFWIGLIVGIVVWMAVGASIQKF